VVVRGGLVRGGLVVDVLVGAREGCLRSAERLAKEKVEASECRIEALLLRDPVVGGFSIRGEQTVQ